MHFISQRLLSVKPSPTLAATQRAAELKAQGRNILALSAGEPDFPTPEWVCHAATKAIQQGQTRYTAVGGTPELKKAIAEKFKRENNLIYRAEEVIASSGGKQIIFNAFLATLNPGDEVIIPAPYWVSYPDIVAIAEGKSVIVPCPASQGFKITPQQLEKVITRRTKWIILNSPSNPTGSVYNKKELQEIAEVLKHYPDIYILSDDIYEHILFIEEPFVTLAQVEPCLKERILTVNGVSKAYAMTGWRLGYAGGPKDLIKAMTDLQSHSTSNPCSISQAAAIAALKGEQGFLKDWNSSFRDRRNLMLQELKSIPELYCLEPQGAFYLYPSCEGALGRKTPEGKTLSTDEEVCEYLLESVGISVVHGAAFGLSPYFRISYATEVRILKEACNLFRKAFSALL